MENCFPSYIEHICMCTLNVHITQLQIYDENLRNSNTELHTTSTDIHTQIRIFIYIKLYVVVCCAIKFAMNKSSYIIPHIGTHRFQTFFLSAIYFQVLLHLYLSFPSFLSIVLLLYKYIQFLFYLYSVFHFYYFLFVISLILFANKLRICNK